MKSGLQAFLLAAALSATAASAQAGAAVELGVFLPMSVSDGQQRLQIAESLAAKLQEALGTPVTGKSFGRFEDFSQALASGSIAFGVIDGWVAGQLPASIEAIAVGQGNAQKHRLQLVASAQSSVPALKGKRVAVVRGAAGAEAKFVTHVMFSGDLEAHKHFKLVPVPNAESALQALQAGAADAALVLSGNAKGLQVAYDGPAFPAAFVVKGRKPLPPGLQAALMKLPVGPVERFTATRGDDLDALRALTLRGPGRRAPVMAESPIERFDAALVSSTELGLTLPAFTPTVILPEETPDD